MKNIFYVYTYLDFRKPGRYCYETVSFLYEPFYIGKGKNLRYLDHLRRTESKRSQENHFSRKLKRILSEFPKKEVERYILFIENGLSEKEAFNLETQLIKEIGRRNLKLGPLTNLTNGGEGTSGRVYSKETRDRLSKLHLGKAGTRLGKKHSEESKTKMRQAHLGKGHSSETKKKMSNRRHSDETKKKMSLARIGRECPEEIRNRISQTSLGRKCSEETKRNMSGRVVSEETRRKISISKIGRKHSEESKEKMRQARLRYLEVQNEEKR